MKRYLKWWVVLSLALAVLCILIITLGRADTPKNRKIAEDLIQYNNAWKNTDNAQQRALDSITNLFHGQMNIEHYYDGPAFLHRSYDFRIARLHEFYSIESSLTNSSEWTLYHEWLWNGHELTRHKLVTIVETNSTPR